MAKKKREGLRKSRRFEIFTRDGFKCVYCGKSPPAVILHVDHIVAVVDGGTDDVSNLCTACSDCNLGKGRKPLSDSAPLDYQVLADEKAERAEQLAAYRDFTLKLRKERDRVVSVVASELFPHQGEEEDATNVAALRAIDRWIDRLPFDKVLEAARIASTNVDNSGSQRTRYFYGVCKRMDADLQQSRKNDPLVELARLPRLMVEQKRAFAANDVGEIDRIERSLLTIATWLPRAALVAGQISADAQRALEHELVKMYEDFTERVDWDSEHRAEVEDFESGLGFFSYKFDEAAQTGGPIDDRVAIGVARDLCAALMKNLRIDPYVLEPAMGDAVLARMEELFQLARAKA